MIGSIKAFVINLENRKVRRQHIIDQFADKSEFEFHLVAATEHQIGAIGLWQTMRRIVIQAQNNNDDYIVICEDDHVFSDDYFPEKMYNIINRANDLKADLLLGGVSYFDDAVEFDSDLFWLSGFAGFQFAIIYARFFERFLALELHSFENIDIKMKEVSDSIFCIYPFISVQKEFGHSDVTKRNEKPGVVDDYFITSQKRLDTLIFLRRHFDNLYKTNEHDA